MAEGAGRVDETLSFSIHYIHFTDFASVHIMPSTSFAAENREHRRPMRDEKQVAFGCCQHLIQKFLDADVSIGLVSLEDAPRIDEILRYDGAGGNTSEVLLCRSRRA